MTFRTYEDIDAWTHARQLTAQIYRISSEGKLQCDSGLRDQIRRSAVSIMSNIAEGFGRGGNNEFVYFLSVARGSALELQSQLYVLLDAGYIPKTTFNDLYRQTHKITRMIGGLLNYLRESEYKGSKYT